MTRPQAFALFLLSLCLLIPTALPPALAAPPAATEKVNCHKGESINKTLAKHPDAASLLLEVSGLCRENVVVTRDRVTLRGTDPATDGIEATASVEQTDAALWVRGAQLVTVENLKLTGGFTGLLATEVSVPHLRVNNCRMEGNVQWGAQLELALLIAEDTTFGPNERFSVGVFAGSRFECRGCTLTLSPSSAVRDNLFVATASSALIFDTALVNGGVNVGNSGASFTDSSIEAFPGAAAVLAGGSSNVGLTRTQVEGPMRFFANTTAGLLGVTQTHGSSSGPVPNSADDAAFVKIGNAAPACPAPPCAPGPPSVASNVLGFNLSNFSNASLINPSQVTGNFNCNLGANAVCPTPANVSGTANCGLCTKP